ncbi:cytochrome c family protein [Novosphingobium panipatense]|uniref:c-type cytochrome n=1 Tax=Novosphingobium TaxID=165696 RepID=UPI000CDA7B5E|nr:cytochrome c family protein [Novosphingobium sp. HII-3]
MAAFVTLAGASLIATALTSPTIAAAAAADGKRLYVRCLACHSTAAGQPNKVGPNLHGFYGKKAASKPGFRYSAALSRSSVKWDDKALDAWLTRPSKLVPGTTMAFPGMTKPEERAALIAYLKNATK